MSALTILATLVAGSAPWTGHEPSRCPAFIGPAAAITVELEGARPSLVVGGVGRALEALPEGGWRIVPEPDERPVLEGSVRREETRLHLRVTTEGCAVEARVTPTEVKDSPHARLVDAGADLAKAERLARAGQYPEAAALTESGCRVLEGALGASHAAVGWCAKRRADRARQASRYADALTWAQRAGSVLAAVAGESNVSTLAARQAEASALYFLSRPAEALELARRVAAGRAAVLGPEHPETLEGRNTIGVSLQQLGRLDEAVAELRALREASARIRGPRDPETLRVANNLALAHMTNDEAEAALALFEEILAARRTALGPRHPDTLNTWSNAAYAASRTGDLDKALRMAEEAAPEFLAVFGESHAATLRLRRRMATILAEMGRPDEAIATLERWIPVMESQLGPYAAETLEAKLNLGRFQAFAGRDVPAEASLRSAIFGFTRTFGPQSAGAAQARDALGFALLRSGRYAEALELFEAAGAADAGSVRGLVRRAGIAQARFELGEREAALRSLGTVLDDKRARFGRDHPESLHTLVTLADLRARAGDAKGAAELLEELVETTERQFGSGTALSESRLASLGLRIGDDFHQAGYRTLAVLLARSNPARALQVAELAKARGLNDALGLRARGDALTAEERMRFTGLARRLAVVDENMLRSEPGSRARLEQGALRVRLRDEMAALAGRGPEPVRAEAVPIPADAIVVSFVVSRDRVVALVARPGGTVDSADLGPAAGLGGAVDALRRLVSTADPAAERVWRHPDGRFAFGIARPAPQAMRVTNPDIALEHLSQRLMDPLRRVAGETRRWIVSPDGPLAFVPFELLRWRGARLVDSVALSFIPSLEMLARAAERRDTYARLPRRELLAVGISRHEGLRDLPAAEAEVRALAASYRSSATLLVGAQATETAFERADPALYKRIHLATHALLSGRDARLSAVVMAPEPGSDGRITAVQWAALPLRADLVVLSACETGLGEATTAEGVIGLPYAMMASGALGSVLSLWQVSDAAAKDFMVRFHARLQQGQPPSRALRETKLEFARSRGPWSSPRHWAPYVLYGAN